MLKLASALMEKKRNEMLMWTLRISGISPPGPSACRLPEIEQPASEMPKARTLTLPPNESRKW